MSSAAPACIQAAACGLLLAVALGPAVAHAQASPGQLGMTVGIGYAGVPGFAGDARGPRTLLGTSWGLPRGFSVSGFGAHDEFFGRDGLRGNANTVGVGAFYNVDVLAVVPFLGLDAVAQWRGGDIAGPVRAGLRGVLGADWRRWRTWSVGGQIEWLGFFPEILDYPAEAAVTLRWTWYLDLRRW